MKKLSKVVDKIWSIMVEFFYVACFALNRVLPVMIIICSLLSMLLTFSLDLKELSLNQEVENLINTKQNILIINSISLFFTLIKTFTEHMFSDKQSEELYKKQSYFELNTYSQSLFNYIRLCFSPKKWDKYTERITESMIQYVLTVKNPQNKEAFLKACLEMSEDLSGYPLKHKSYACNPVCKNLQLIPEEKLHSTFQEIHSILKERKENYEPF